MQYAGSTPGDSLIKVALGIPVTTPIDFMKWELLLNNNAKRTFTLIINYGISQPNTNGFKPGNDTLSFTGIYKLISTKSDHFKGQVVQLTSGSFSGGYLSLAKIGNQMLHILQPGYRLMVGNGGWSYTLNMINREIQEPEPLYTVVPAKNILNDPAVQIVFDGRTPCIEITRVFKFNTTADCLKLKWRLTLNRDPATLQPATYQLQRTDVRSTGTITGNWTIITLSDSAIIFKLDPEQPEKSLSILAGDENVLFFLDKDNRLFTGNSDFSYTLNRKNPV